LSATTALFLICAIKIGGALDIGDLTGTQDQSQRIAQSVPVD